MESLHFKQLSTQTETRHDLLTKALLMERNTFTEFYVFQVFSELVSSFFSPPSYLLSGFGFCDVDIIKLKFDQQAAFVNQAASLAPQ